VTEREVAVCVAGLTRVFEGVAAVDQLNLDIYEREFFSLIGPSGCGKTTTLRMIAGLETMTAGRVLVDGRDISADPAYRRPVNTVFQQYGLFPHLNVFENVAFGLRERREPRRRIESDVRRMLDLVGLGGRETARPRELSGGQQQRVALARALILNPKVLLLDEPLGALDLKLRRQMQTLLKDLQRELGITFVYVTHDQEEAFSMSDRVGVMNAGILEQVGEPGHVYRRPKTLFVANFVGGSNCLSATISETAAPGSYAAQLSSTKAVIRAEGVVGLKVGEEVALVLRPETARLTDHSASALRAEGSVAEISFYGPQIVYRVSSNGLGDLTILSTTETRARVLEFGQQVTVSWDPSDMWIVARD
jgi:spermidine/putrescine transport system ATP-binding protein